MQKYFLKKFSVRVVFLFLLFFVQTAFGANEGLQILMAGSLPNMPKPITDAPKIRSITPVKSTVVHPILIQGEIRGSLLSGKAWITHTGKKDFENVVWTLTDEYGAVVWTENVFWQDCYLSPDNPPQVIIPFHKDLSDKKLSGKYSLTFTAFDDKQFVVANGSESVIFANKESSLKISDLKLEKNDQTMNVSFLVSHGENADNFKKTSVIPHLSVYQETMDKPVVLEVSGEAQELIGKGKKQVNFSFAIPSKPQSYMVEVDVRDIGGKLLSGTLQKSFLVDGDFGELKIFHFSPKSFLSRDEDLEIFLEGSVRNTKDPFKITIDMQQFFGGELEKTKSFPIEYTLSFNDFKGGLLYPVEGRGATKFSFVVRIIQNGNVIEEKKFESDEYPIPVVPEKTNFWPFVFWIIVLLVLFGGGAFLWQKKVKNKTSLFLFALSSFVFFGILNVAYSAPYNEWRSPYNNYEISALNGAGDPYNGIIEDLEDLRLLVLNGYLCDSVDNDCTVGEDAALLFPDMSTIQIFLCAENDENCVGNSTYLHATWPLLLGSGNLFENNLRYHLYIDAGIGGYWQSGTVPGSGKYDIQLLFDPDGSGSNTYLVNPTVGPLADPHVIFDNDAPTGGFSFNPNVATNTGTTVSPICNDGSGVGCFVSDGLGTYTSYVVKGNFCADGTQCFQCFRSAPQKSSNILCTNASLCGATCADNENRQFIFCDILGNCQSAQFDFDKFDDQAPLMDQPFLEHINNPVSGNCDSATCANTFEANEEFKITLSGILEPNTTTDATLNPNPCGDIDFWWDNSGLFLHSPKCTPKKIPCRVSGGDATIPAGIGGKIRMGNCGMIWPETLCPQTAFGVYLDKDPDDPILCFPILPAD